MADMKKETDPAADGPLDLCALVASMNIDWEKLRHK